MKKVLPVIDTTILTKITARRSRASKHINKAKSVANKPEISSTEALAASGKAHVNLCNRNKTSNTIDFSPEDMSRLNSYYRQKQLSREEINEIQAVFIKSMKKQLKVNSIKDIIDGPVDDLLRLEAQIEKILRGKFNPREFYIHFSELVTK